MAASGPAAAAVITAASATAAGGPAMRPLPYTAAAPLRQRRQQPGPPALAAAAGTPAAAAATPAPFRTSPATTFLPLTPGSATVTARLHGTGSQPGFPVAASHRRLITIARYFREGSGPEGLGGEGIPAPEPAPAPPGPPSVVPVPRNARGAAHGGPAGSRTAAAESPPPALQGNAVPFVASTRQRHAATAAATSDATASRGEVAAGTAAAGAAARRSREPGSSNEDDAAYAGAEEGVRRRAQQLRDAAMRREALLRAVSLHPTVLVNDLAAEATVPYGTAGSLDLPVVQGEEGEAAGPPSRGAGRHVGLAVESVDPDTGGFTTSFPAVDPVYDDVGRAIREEEEDRRRRRRPATSSGGTLLAAEARARKAATAEELREVLLDAAPELQDTYHVFGVPGGGGGGVAQLRRRAAAGGEVTASDEEVEELLATAPFGHEGAALSAAAAAVEQASEVRSALTDPLGLMSGGATTVDPVAALDALQHRQVLDLLESGAVVEPAATSFLNGSVDGGYADISDIMPSPFPYNTAPRTAAAAEPGSISRASIGGRNVPMTSALRTGACGDARRARGGGRGRQLPLAGAAATVRRGVRAGRARRQARRTQPGSGLPPFYHTSPDVPEEDLLPHRPYGRAHVTTAAAAAARAVRDAERPPVDPDVAMADGGAAAAAAGIVGSNSGWELQAPLYNTSPDVPDREVESRPGETTTAVAAAEPMRLPERRPGGGKKAAKPRTDGVEESDVTASAAAATSQQAAAAHPAQAAAAPPPPPPKAGDDGRRLRSLSDVDRQFIEMDAVSSWDERANDLRSAMRTAPKLERNGLQARQAALKPPGPRGANSSLQPQTIGIHGSGGGAAAGGDGRAVAVLRVPSQTYGMARTAAVLAADGQLMLLARPTGPSPERVRAALKLLRSAPGSTDFRASAAEAAAVSAADDKRVAAANEAVVAAAMAAVGTAGMELEAALRQPPPLSAPSVDERELHPGLILGQSEIDPGEVAAEPAFLLNDSWAECHDPHDPHAAPPMMEGERLSPPSICHEDYDEVMGQIHDGQRSGWCEDAVNGMFDSDVY